MCAEHSLTQLIPCSGGASTLAGEMDVAGKWDNGVGMDDTVEVDTVVQEAPQRNPIAVSLYTGAGGGGEKPTAGAAGVITPGQS